MKTQITPEQFKATIGRGITNTSAIAKPYISKPERAPYKHNVSALATSLERGKGLVA